MFVKELICDRLFQHFPVEATLRPATEAPNRKQNYNYYMALQRSPRHTSQSVAEPAALPSPKPQPRPRAVPGPAVANPVGPPKVKVPGVPRQQDQHIRVWLAMRSVRAGPKPPVGRPPATTRTPATSPVPAPIVYPPEYVDAPWSLDLSRFGPIPTATRTAPSALDTTDQVSPPWLEQLQDEWVAPTEFLGLLQPDWKAIFPPLYAASPTWQRVWRNGIGLPRQGYFMRNNLLFKTGSYTDRLCVPCSAVRLAISTIRPSRDSVAAIRPPHGSKNAATGVACGETSIPL